MKLTLKFVFFLAILLMAASLSACGSAASPTQALTPITVQLKYLHQAQFAGFYAADQNGYYAEEGLQVTFLQGSPDIDLEDPILDGTAQFGVTGAENMIAARAAGESLSAIAVIYRRNPLVFMTLADSGITEPGQIVGKTVQYNQTTRIVLNAMLANVGISPGQFQEIEAGSDLDLFFSGQIQVWNAFLINEVIKAQKNGYEVNLIYPDDYGIHFYSDTLYTKDDLIAENPDLVLRFLRATLKGWTYAVENPNMIAPMVAQYNPEADIEHETDMMLASIPLVNTGEDQIGWMKAETWADMEQTLREQGVLTAPLDLTRVFTMQFLQEIYK